MIHLSAFADEISADLHEQIAVLRSENIHHLDLRGVWNTNVLDLTDQQAAEIKRTLDAHNIAVAAIGSPIGKIPIDSSFDEHLHRFERAITLARFFQTPLSASSLSIRLKGLKVLRIQRNGEMKCSDAYAS